MHAVQSSMLHMSGVSVSDSALDPSVDMDVSSPEFVVLSDVDASGSLSTDVPLVLEVPGPPLVLVPPGRTHKMPLQTRSSLHEPPSHVHCSPPGSQPVGTHTFSSAAQLSIASHVPFP
jgi:hypothetical protein